MARIQMTLFVMMFVVSSTCSASRAATKRLQLQICKAAYAYALQIILSECGYACERSHVTRVLYACRPDL